MYSKWFTFKNLRLHGSHLGLKKNKKKHESNSDSNPKQKSELNIELPPRDINHTSSFRIGNFLSRRLPSSGWSMNIGGGTLQYTTRHSRNQNLQRSTMGGGQRSRIARDPHSRTLGVIPRVGILDTFASKQGQRTSRHVRIGTIFPQLSRSRGLSDFVFALHSEA